MKNERLFAFCLGVPAGEVLIRSLGKAAGLWRKPISRVRVVGSEGRVRWSLEETGLRIQKPDHNPSLYTLGFEIS